MSLARLLKRLRTIEKVWETGEQVSKATEEIETVREVFGLERVKGAVLTLAQLRGNRDGKS